MAAVALGIGIRCADIIDRNGRLRIVAVGIEDVVQPASLAEQCVRACDRHLLVVSAVYLESGLRKIVSMSIWR